MWIKVKDDSDEEIWLQEEHMVGITSSEGEFQIEVITGNYYYTSFLPRELLDEDEDYAND